MKNSKSVYMLVISTDLNRKTWDLYFTATIYPHVELLDDIRPLIDKQANLYRVQVCTTLTEAKSSAVAAGVSEHDIRVRTQIM